MSNSNSSQLSGLTITLRAIAGGIGAGTGVVISFVLLVVIGALQGLGLIGGPTWEGSSVWAFLIAAMLVGGIWGVGTLKWRPSMGRALFAAIGGFTLVVVVQMILRWLLSLSPVWNFGSVSLFGSFTAGFSALWGMGAARRGYNIVETSGAAVEHDLEAPVEVLGAFNPITLGKNLTHFGRTKIIPIVRPLLAPLVLALGVAMIGFVVVIVLGAVGPSVVQTNNTSASATTAAGYMVGVTMFGGPVSKVAFLLIIAVFILGGIGTIGLGLALLFNALSVEVKDAQKMAPVPLDFSDNSKIKGPFGHTINFFVRLRKFFVEWLSDITGGALRSIIR